MRTRDFFRQTSAWMVAFAAMVALASLGGIEFSENQAVADDTVVHDGLQRRSGKHVRLVTDLPSSPQLDQLVTTFDAAVPQWEAYMQLAEGTLDQWRVDAHLIVNKDVFEKLDLIDPRVPDFSNGYAQGNQIYVIVQPSEYYTRHLLLHEGVHALVIDRFGDTGPTWFGEGLAELLATHDGVGESLHTVQVPASREATPHWGRFKRLSEVRDDDRVPSVETVMKYPPSLAGDVESYGWSWTLVSMFNADPVYRQSLLQALPHVRDTDQRFNQWFFGRLGAEWPVVQARWRVLAQDFDYGYDLSRERVELSREEPLWDGKSITIDVKADRGWQSIGVRVARGTRLNLSADREVVLDDQPKPWVSHPPGVTIDYHDGRPLGQLVARFVPNVTPRGDRIPPLKTLSIGDAASFAADEACWLLLRVNDHPGSLMNNRGSYRVTVSR